MRVFVPPEDIEKKECIKLNADKSHYLTSVLRCKKGDTVSIIDGKGKAYEAEIIDITKKHVFINIISEVRQDTESALNLILCQGILKGEKMDLVIQKTTELGVKEIIPLITERCIVKETKKIKRWQKIAEEAAEQCGRTVIPVVHEPVELGSWLTAHSSKQIRGFIFYEGGGEPLSKVVSKFFHKFINLPVCLFVGPEGGFTTKEVRLSEEYGLTKTSLGKRILRAETAAIVSVALIQNIIEECL